MSLHYNFDTCQSIETFPPVALDSSRNVDSPRPMPIQDEPRDVRDDDRSRYLPNGARIVSSDAGSNTVLCTHQGEWSVWVLDADGELVRGSYFKSMREAAFDYAEHVMGCHTEGSDIETSDVEK